VKFKVNWWYVNRKDVKWWRQWQRLGAVFCVVDTMSSPTTWTPSCSAKCNSKWSCSYTSRWGHHLPPVEQATLTSHWPQGFQPATTNVTGCYVFLLRGFLKMMVSYLDGILLSSPFTRAWPFIVELSWIRDSI
jgi:hypothetical protein